MDLFYDISWHCIKDSTKYTKMLEKERIFDFLHGLNKDLDEVCGCLLSTKPFPSIKEALAEIKREESREWVMINVKLNPRITPIEHLNRHLHT